MQRKMISSTISFFISRESLCLAKECREFEERYKVDYKYTTSSSRRWKKPSVNIWHSSSRLPQSTNIFARSQMEEIMGPLP